MSQLCGDTELQALVDLMNGGSNDGLKALTDLIDLYPEDPRLHFMKGSALISSGQLIEAHASLTKAVEIAPDFAIARFQLGFFQLTSGESNEALKTWAPLDALGDDHYLNVFAKGLRHLIRDEFADCIDTLNHGIALNTENAPLNNDMALIIEQCQTLKSDTPPETEEAVTSTTSALLGQFAANPTKH